MFQQPETAEVADEPLPRVFTQLIRPQVPELIAYSGRSDPKCQHRWLYRLKTTGRAIDRLSVPRRSKSGWRGQGDQAAGHSDVGRAQNANPNSRCLRKNLGQAATLNLRGLGRKGNV